VLGEDQVPAALDERELRRFELLDHRRGHRRLQLEQWRDRPTDLRSSVGGPAVGWDDHIGSLVVDVEKRVQVGPVDRVLDEQVHGLRRSGRAGKCCA